MAMDPEEAVAVVTSIQAVGDEWLMVLATRAFGRVKQSRRPTVHPARLVPQRRLQADRHRLQEVAEACRVRASRVVDLEAATAADGLRNRGKILGCMKH
jgi:hypothetical protein